MSITHEIFPYVSNSLITNNDCQTYFLPLICATANTSGRVNVYSRHLVHGSATVKLYTSLLSLLTSIL